MFIEKIRLILSGIGAAVMVALYAMAFSRGRAREQVKQARADADREEKRAEFFKRMAEQPIDAPRNQEELINRIRDKGL
jgi:hypothetical protein